MRCSLAFFTSLANAITFVAAAVTSLINHLQPFFRVNTWKTERINSSGSKLLIRKYRQHTCSKSVRALQKKYFVSTQLHGWFKQIQRYRYVKDLFISSFLILPARDQLIRSNTTQFWRTSLLEWSSSCSKAARLFWKMKIPVGTWVGERTYIYF